MIGYLLKTTYRLALYTGYTIGLIAFVIYAILSGRFQPLTIYLLINVSWMGLYYIWNLITADITIDIMEYLDYKAKDADFYTIPRIIERIKQKNIWNTNRTAPQSVTK